MPDANGKLSDADVLYIAHWLITHSQTDRKWDVCPFCGKEEMNIADHIGNIPVFRPPTDDNPFPILSSGFTFPYVQVLCENCGYTHQFSAVRMGLLKNPAKEQSNG